jgi:hypothetical protein
MTATATEVSESGDYNDSVYIYVDKSSGINEAFNSENGGREAGELLTEIVGIPNVKYFDVLRDIKPRTFDGVAPTNYYANKINYDPTEPALLEKALNTIVENNGLSFFITDGEEFDSKREEANHQPWAQVPMENWIKKGNSIHFWTTDYNVKNKANKPITKHLYFMAFVPAQILKDNNFLNIVKSLNAVGTKHLELSNTSWRINKPDWAEQSTGLDAYLLKEGVFEKDLYIRNLDNTSGSYEFVSLQYPIKAEVLKAEGALKNPQFYRNLFVDLSNNKFFDVSKIDIDVTEISKDINNYAKFDELISNVSTTVKDGTTNKTILNPDDEYACFYDIVNDKAVLKNTETYRKNYENSLKELFEFDKEIFKYSMKDNLSKAELGFKMHKNFNEADKKLESDFLYNIVRVDFKIAEFKEKPISELQFFSWSSMTKPSQLNDGLSRSVKQVISATQGKDKIIHTVFIKFIKDN